MTIRPAQKSDRALIEKLYAEHEFKLDPAHLRMMLIAEDDLGSIAIMSLNTVLECSFLTMKGASKRGKIEALKRLVLVGKEHVKNFGYDGVHAFSNESIAPILKRHFEFVPAKGENLFLFVE